MMVISGPWLTIQAAAFTNGIVLQNLSESIYVGRGGYPDDERPWIVQHLFEAVATGLDLLSAQYDDFARQIDEKARQTVLSSDSPPPPSPMETHDPLLERQESGLPSPTTEPSSPVLGPTVPQFMRSTVLSAESTLTTLTELDVEFPDYEDDVMSQADEDLREREETLAQAEAQAEQQQLAKAPAQAQAGKFPLSLPFSIPPSYYALPSIPVCRNRFLPLATKFLDDELHDLTPLRDDMWCTSYVAHLNDGRKVVVKYVTRYGEDTHRFLAELGYAPKLIHIGLLWRTSLDRPFAMRMVVMEYVEGCDATQKRISSAQYSHLKAALHAMHNRGDVHGDLRAANIRLCADDTIRILDFDWAGPRGEVFYPYDLLNNGVWHPDVQANIHGRLFIRKRFDYHMFYKTVRLNRQAYNIVDEV